MIELLAVLTINLALIAGCVLYLTTHPPRVNVFMPEVSVRGHLNVGDVVIEVSGTMVPAVVRLQTQAVSPIDEAVRGPMADETPMPEELFEYIQQESDEYARETRVRHARTLFGELRDWAVVRRQLEREDATE